MSTLIQRKVCTILMTKYAGDESCQAGKKGTAAGLSAAVRGGAVDVVGGRGYWTKLGVGSAGIPTASISRARASTFGSTEAIKSSSRSAATPG